MFVRVRWGVFGLQGFCIAKIAPRYERSHGGFRV